MNIFFGCAITNAKNTHKNSNKRYKRGGKGDPLKRKVFFKTDLNETEHLPSSETDQHIDTENDRNSLSLIDIINELQTKEFHSLPKQEFEKTVYKVVDPNPYAEDF